jgi:hypothetical protein
MALIEAVTFEKKTIGWKWDCPGCKSTHVFWTDQWQFNGDFKRPTFRPSLGTRWPTGYCHVVVTDGILGFQMDSTHELAGKSVPMLEMEASTEPTADEPEDHPQTIKEKIVADALFKYQDRVIVIETQDKGLVVAKRPEKSKSGEFVYVVDVDQPQGPAVRKEFAESMLGPVKP